MSHCYEGEKRLMISLISVAISLTFGLVLMQYAQGQSFLDDWYKDFLEGYREGEREQKLDNLTPDKDCPATQHVHSGICMDNYDGKAHGRTDNESRSSTLDCASNNEFMCKSEGLMK